MKKLSILLLCTLLLLPLITGCAGANQENQPDNTNNGTQDTNDQQNQNEDNEQNDSNDENNTENNNISSECNCVPTNAPHWEYISFYEALLWSSDIIIAQFVDSTWIGNYNERLEFVVSERILGNAPDTIFIYIQHFHGQVFDFSENFEKDTNYLLPLRRPDSLLANFHRDGFWMSNRMFINLDNITQSTRSLESLNNHLELSDQLDLNSRSLGADLLSFITETTMNNMSQHVRMQEEHEFIHSNDIETIINGSHNILVVEITEKLWSNEPTCLFNTDVWRGRIIHPLKGELQADDLVRIVIPTGKVSVGGRYILAIGSVDSDADSAGVRSMSLSSRNSVFPMEYEQQIGEILGIR